MNINEGDLVGCRSRRRGNCLRSRNPRELTHPREQRLGVRADPGGRGISDRGHTQCERFHQGCIFYENDVELIRQLLI